LRDAVGDELESGDARFGVFGVVRGGDVVCCEGRDVGEGVSGGAGTCGGGGHGGVVVLDERVETQSGYVRVSTILRVWSG
jgi:hypothetical protein